MSIKEDSRQQSQPITKVSADGTMTRFGKIEDLDRAFDLKYWQSRCSEERFDAAWSLVVDFHLRKGGTLNELRLQRTVGSLQRFPR